MLLLLHLAEIILGNIEMVVKYLEFTAERVYMKRAKLHTPGVHNRKNEL